MDASNISNNAGNMEKLALKLTAGEDGVIYPWVAPMFAIFASTGSLPSHEGAVESDNLENNLHRLIWDEDGEIKPGMGKKFTDFLLLLNERANKRVACLEMEMEGTQNPVLEIDEKVSAPLSPGKHKEGGQEHTHGEGCGNHEMERMELQTVHKNTINSIMEMATEQSKFKATDKARREKLLELLHLAACTENSIFKDANSRERWYLMNRDFFHEEDNTIEEEEKDGGQVLSTGNELNRNMEKNPGVLQGETSMKNSNTTNGPPGNNFSVIIQKTGCMGEKSGHISTDNATCSTAGPTISSQWIENLFTSASADGSHIPQYVEKVAQLLQHVLDSASVLQHVSQSAPNEGTRSLQHINGQKQLEPNVVENGHVNVLKNSLPLSTPQQHSMNEQEINRNVMLHQDDKDGKDKTRTSFAHVLKYGQNNISLNPSHTDAKSFLDATVSQAPLQGKIISSPHCASDESSLFIIKPEVLQQRLNICKFSIVGRLTLGKGEKTWTHKSLKEKLEGIWSLKTAWKFISLGRGYFHILLNSQDDWDKVWSRGPLHLRPGVFRLQRWKIDFDPWAEKTSFAQIWLRIYHLPWALWDPSIIVGIARKVGVPLRFDNVTIDGEFGHYARILVDVDLSKPLKQSVHLECGKHMFEVKLVPESLPAFCRGCSNIGHDTNDCRSIFKRKEAAVNPRNVGGEDYLDALPVVNPRKEASSSNVSNEIKKVQPNKQHTGTEWRRKNDKGPRMVTKEKENVNGIVESITDFSAQTDSHASFDDFSGCVAVSNQFAALEEDVELDNPKFDSGPDHQAQQKIISGRWSDILDEEDKHKDSEPFHAYCDANSQEEKAHYKDISEIRKGLQQLSYAKMLHKPSSSNKKQKQKIGIKQSKDPIGSPNC